VPSFDGVVAGLGARDTLRTEMGYALHGHELSLEINPLEAGVGWAVAMDKAAFIGKDALHTIKRLGLSRRAVALRALDKTIPRAGMSVKRGENQVGRVTSGTFSPNLKTGIALALVDAGVQVGDVLTVDVRGRVGEYEVVKTPFVQSQVR
jgi:aminomethyltransferase